MPEGCGHRAEIAKKIVNTPLRLLSTLTVTGWVTVLLFSIVVPVPIQARNTNGGQVLTFEFACDVYGRAGQGCIEGLMASDGNQYRIAIYWIVPDLFRERSFFRWSDIIFDGHMVHYWMQEMKGSGVLRLADVPRSRMVVQNRLEETVRYALAVTGREMYLPEHAGALRDMRRFFQGSSGQNDYIYEPVCHDMDSNKLPLNGALQLQAVDVIPHGREYSKETQSGGIVVWRVRTRLTEQSVVTVSVTPGVSIDERSCADAFAVETLGHWALVPTPYRTYWSFDSAYSELMHLEEPSVHSRDLYDRMTLYLDDEDIPIPVSCALQQLRFKTALLTDDPDRVRSSMEASVARLCRDGAPNTYECLLAIARICGKVEGQYPQRAQEWLRPVIAQTVRHTAPTIMSSVGRLMTTIEANRWFTYGRLLLEEIRDQGVEDESAVKKMISRLDASRTATSREPPDPCEACETVNRYMAGLGAGPPAGAIYMNDLRQIMEDAFAKHGSDGQSPGRHELVESVLRSIGLTVGEGPFCGDREKIAESIERFSTHYPALSPVVQSDSAVLATFLGLYFYDISTPEDHNVLLSQFCRCSGEIQSHVNTMLSDRGLNSLVAPKDVEGELAVYERIFRSYLDDPLWPAFKFPWTRIEESRLAAKLRLRLMQLEPVLDEMALRVKHGGASPELKDRTINEISRAAQQLLPEAAFLRVPPYPGISCHYRGGRGFTVVIESPLYVDSDRPKEEFKAMQYFHLGHRLQAIVEQEREWTRPDRARNDERETVTQRH